MGFVKILHVLAYIALVVLAFIVFVRLFLMKRELGEAKDRKKRYFSFEYARSGDHPSRYLGDSITRFLNDYGMTESHFQDVIVTPAVEARMKEYRSQHKPDEQ